MRIREVSRLFLPVRPVISINRAGTWADYTLCSPWHLEAELEPVFWGQPDPLMMDGSFIDPLRGFRFRATLSTGALDLNDLGVLAELRRVSAGFRFYPWGRARPCWDVYTPTSLYHLNKDTPRNTPAEFELLGSVILSAEETKDLAVILEPSVSCADAGPWVVTASWLPMITAGNMNVTVRDTADNTDQGVGPVANGRLVFVTEHLESPPMVARFSHSLTPYEKEVIL